MNIDLSIVIPAYNEEKRLEPTLRLVLEYLHKKKKKDRVTSELIVVDDGSSDTTAQITEKYPEVRLVRHQKNKGKGAAVRTGMLAAKGVWRIFMDVDLATPLSEIDHFFAVKKETPADVLFASREVSGANIKRMKFSRILLGRTFNRMVNIIILPKVKDSQCGFKMFSAQAAQEVFSRQSLDGFAFDVEILFLARALGFKILEVPVTWMDQPGTTVRSSDPVRMLGQILKIRLHAWNGQYDLSRGNKSRSQTKGP